MREDAVRYQEALDYLYSFVDYSLTRGFKFTPEKFDLSRMVDFLGLLGNPHHQYRCIHVAGTKGKGSTAALIASGLRAAGYQVGFYSSPHLQEYTERIQVNGRPIAIGRLADLVDEVKPTVAQIERLTTFEITTAIAMLEFARQKVDVAVFEVGLGGRLDATNVIDPLLSVITSISMDHMAVLGDTLVKIATEKAGIIKPGHPVLAAAQQEAAGQVIEQAAREAQSPLYRVGKDFHYKVVSHSLDGQTFRAWRDGEQPLELKLPLLGLHQVENATTAFGALKIINETGLNVPDTAIQAGFAQVEWPGRFELLRREPPVIVDSAHNRDSARRLRQALDDYFPGRPVTLIFGASEDKDIEGMFAELMPRITRVIATQSIHPRAMEASKLVALAEQFDRPAEAVMPLENALEAALEQVRQDPSGDRVVLAAGSLFIAAAVREIWQKISQDAA